jgi:pimeloyl-ACP methyl ester carboxylesterase
MDDEGAQRAALRWTVVLIRLAARLTALPYVLVVLLVMTGSPTWSSVAYLAGIGVLLWGLMTLPARAGAKAQKFFGLRRPRGLARGAVLGLLAVALVRGCSARSGETLTFSPEPRFVDRLLDEKDVALSGTRVLVAGGMLHDDAAELPAAMRSAYSKMRDEEGDAPSPVVATYLGMQSSSEFDLLVFAPPRDEPARGAVVFLHGFAGNFALPCWQMARAVAPLGVITACPSTRWVGDWWSADGERTVRRTVEMLRARGVSRIVLAGLSNGGYGATRLAPRMRGTFVGVILISGASPDAGPPGIPALVIHGRKDTMADFSEATGYAARTGAKLVALDAGHFAMLVRARENDAAVRAFVASTAL